VDATRAPRGQRVGMKARVIPSADVPKFADFKLSLAIRSPKAAASESANWLL